jgi:alkylhydroperoxidase family enzyme
MPRIPPIGPPYDSETAAALRKWMPPGSDLEPLRIFRTLFVHRDLANRMRVVGAGLLAHGMVEPRDREVVIHRVCARAGAEDEWGAHAVGYGEPAGLTEEQLTATVHSDADDPVWSAQDRLLVRLADEIYDTATISDDLWRDVSAIWNHAQLIELVVIAGWYRAIAGVVNATGVELEAWARRFPKPTTDIKTPQSQPA